MELNAKKILLSTFAATLALSLTACDGSSSGGDDTPKDNTITPDNNNTITPDNNNTTTPDNNSTGTPVVTYTPKFTGDSAAGIKDKFDNQTLTHTTIEDKTGVYTADQHWTADKVYRLNGRVLFTGGSTLTIEPGTVVIGAPGDGVNASWLAIDKGSKIMAEGTADKHIVFTSETAFNGDDAAYGQWGSLVLIGNAAMDDQVGPYEVDPSLVPGKNVADDNSGVLKYVDILNSGITIEEDKELNGLSLVGVGSGTTIENILVDKSDDDCIEAWGGTVNMTNITVSECTDDQFDIDDGYSGTVTNLRIKQTTGYAAMEMSGDTVATFNNLYIDSVVSAKEGGIYFKKDGIGGHFNNVFLNYNTDNGYGAFHSAGTFDAANTSFTNVHVANSSAEMFTGDSAAGIEAAFNAQTVVTTIEDKTGTYTVDQHWTADKVYRLNGRVLFTGGSTLTIEPGTVVIGAPGDGVNASWLAIDKGSKIMAEGTADKHIVFTSETAFNGDDAAYGQWGSLVLIGNAGDGDQVGPYEVDPTLIPGVGTLDDNSGVLKYVDILNSGITIEEDKELNGLSLVGVGSGTTIKHVVVDKSDDDCIETWGGTVNMTDVAVSECTDDQFDIDDGYSGTVTNLRIKQTTGYAGMEMSGDTAATFHGLYLDSVASAKEGGIYFKKDGIGGHFVDAFINYPSTRNNGYGAFHSAGTFDAANTSFKNVQVADATPTELAE